METLELTQEEIQIIQAKREAEKSDYQKSLEVIAEKRDQMIKAFKNIRNRKEIDRKKLIEAGLREGIDFVVYVEYYCSEREYESVPYIYRAISHRVNLIYDRFSNYGPVNEITTGTDRLESYKGKYICYSVVGNSRAVKLETIIKKLKQKNKQAEEDFHKAQSMKDHTTKIIEELEKLYPTAKAKKGREWISYNRYRRGQDIETVTLTFPSGSFVVWRVYADGSKGVHKIYNAVKQTVEETLKMFSEQPTGN